MRVLNGNYWSKRNAFLHSITDIYRSMGTDGERHIVRCARLFRRVYFK